MASTRLMLLLALVIYSCCTCGTCVNTGPALTFSHSSNVDLVSLNPAAELRGHSSSWSLSLHSVSALTPDGRGGLFLADYSDGASTIHRLELNGGGNLTRVDLDTELLLVEGLAYAPDRNRLFVTDSRRGQILSLSLDGADGVAEETVLAEMVLPGKDKPRGIAFDRCSGYLFWVVDGPSPRIERTDADGYGRIVVVEGDMGKPRAVAVDAVRGRIYWTDSKRFGGRGFAVESADIHGEDRATTCGSQRERQAPYGLAVGGDGVYWTDGRNMAVWKAGKSGKTDLDCQPESVARTSLSRPLGIAVVGADGEGEQCNERGVEAVPPPPKEHRPDDFLFRSNPCDGFCLHGGNCSVTEVGSAECWCAAGFYGTRCESCLGGRIEDCLVMEVEDEEEVAAEFRRRRSRDVAVIASLGGAVAVSVLCLAWCLVASFRRNKSRKDDDGAGGKGVSIISGKKNRPRTFSGAAVAALLTGEDKPSERVVVDLEDCCRMTICDKPCVEWSSRQKSPRKKTLSTKAKAAAVDLCSPHRSPVKAQQQKQDQVHLLLDEDVE